MRIAKDLDSCFTTPASILELMAKLQAATVRGLKERIRMSVWRWSDDDTQASVLRRGAGAAECAGTKWRLVHVQLQLP